MSEKRSPSWLQIALALVRGALRDRDKRRRFITGLVFFGVALVWLGAFLIEDWMVARPVVFLAFWGFVAWIVAMLFLLAIYDMLRLRVEEKNKRK